MRSAPARPAVPPDPPPLLVQGVSARDLRASSGNLQQACHRAVVTAAGPAARLAAELARRAAKLRAVALTLRVRGADQAVALFLARDALVPAARWLCDRLVELRALRELTGRPNFRLYGL